MNTVMKKRKGAQGVGHRNLNGNLPRMGQGEDKCRLSKETDMDSKAYPVSSQQLEAPRS